MLDDLMRIIAESSLTRFWEVHPEAKPSLRRWIDITRASTWHAVEDVSASFAASKRLDGERVRFEVAGGKYRMIVAYKFKNQIAFVKFVGTHKEYDAVDALTVSLF